MTCCKGLVYCDTQATEIECKHILETELTASLVMIEQRHRSKIEDLQRSLALSEGRITDLEVSLRESETRIRHHSGPDRTVELETFRSQLLDTENENSRLKAEVSALEVCQHLTLDGWLYM